MFSFSYTQYKTIQPYNNTTIQKMILATILVTLLSMPMVIASPATQHIVFHTNETLCENVDHPYNTYYRSPCDQWKHMVKTQYHDTIVCKIVHHGFDNALEYSDCVPNFEFQLDTIQVDYTVTRGYHAFTAYAYASTPYVYYLKVDAKLRRPIHPVFGFVLVAVFILYPFTAILFMSNRRRRRQALEYHFWLDLFAMGWFLMYGHPLYTPKYAPHHWRPIR